MSVNYFVGQSQYTLYASGDADDAYFGDDGSNNYSGYKDYPVPLKIPVTDKIVKVAYTSVNALHSPRVLLTESGRLYIWGYGFGATPKLVTLPHTTGWSDVYVGHSRLVAVHGLSGKIYGTGDDYQLGTTPDTYAAYTLLSIGTDTDWLGAKFFIDSDITYSIKSDGSLYWFGQHDHTVLGDPVIVDDVYQPGVHLLATNISTFGINGANNIAIENSNGTAGSLRIGGTADAQVPNTWIADGYYNISTNIVTAEIWDKFPHAGTANKMLTTSGDYYYWGYASDAAIFGDGETGSYQYDSPVFHSSGWSELIESFNNTTIGVKQDGTFWGWSSLDLPPCGYGSSLSSNTPRQIRNEYIPDCDPPLLAQNMDALELLVDATRDDASGDLILPTLSVSGSVLNETIYGNMNADIPGITIDGSVLYFGNTDIELSAIVINGFIETGHNVFGAIKLSPLNVTAEALKTFTSDINIVLPKIKTKGSAVKGLSASSSINIPKIKADGKIEIELSAIGNAILNRLLVDGTIEAITEDSYVVLSINKQNYAFTKYQNNNFKGAVTLGEDTILLKDDGLYLVGGDNDNNQHIDAFVVFPQNDYGDSYVKRIRSAYVSGRSNGDIDIEFIFADGNSFVRRIENTGTYDDTIMTSHVMGQRITNGRSFKTKISSVDGSSLSLKDMEIFLTRINRRLRNG